MLNRYSILLGIVALSIAAFACRPVIAIGLPELIILTVLIAVLLGPALFKLYRFLDKVQKTIDSEKKEKK